MSTILNSIDDQNPSFSTKTSNHFMANEHQQQIDTTLTKKFLSGHRGNYPTFLQEEITVFSIPMNVLIENKL